ncbi:Stk1 family PASTA domain-containing Ser/Thr kinase [Halobacillus yeomjeoni]|uniref:Serine/threonine-protein kinase PrkC n=1 Tax=Halobacillus yeomjeoni TaxID=311194 RepID=A0A931MU48_9BACI|nr:Stk1 family PASTA domain-containing Ser/Thr kinase [Halobacillus yeomjeoni]MBH0229126.1 Stk1 family PASTA domain-containing Ser/Thr kinase [Halobacillus yeomjeoni]
MLINRLLSERYKVKEMIGGGGMANVYLAHDIILDRNVAIKVLRLEHGNDEEFIARFHREAQSATSLSHPNIVNIYDVGEEEEIYYMVMEFVDGMTLKQYIQKNSPIEISEAVDIMKQITTAIGHAHDNDIVHRDIKPQNILIDHYGHVKVTDFGIAMALSATALTQTNSVLGSVHYLSPEQARGGMATKKSDVYSLGIVFFELLTGRLPFSGESPVSIALKHLQHETPSLKRWIEDFPQSVENIVLKATSKDPFHRYSSVFEMEDDLESALDPERYDEPLFKVPVEDDDDEKTKAIPVITNDSYQEDTGENTIIHHQTNSNTIVSGAGKPNGETGSMKKAAKKKKKKWPWIASLLALLVIAAGIAIFTIPGIVQPADVEMIDVTGKEYEEAYSELSDLNLDVDRRTMFSDDVEEGYVIKTDPEPGMMIKEESTVIVYSSRGREKVELGDYTGQDIERVTSELESKGYKSVVPVYVNSDEPDGQVIEHMSPQPDEKVIPDETNVILRVSKGPPMVNLRPLTGMTEEEAKQYLEDNNLKANVTENYSNQVPQGNVISQSPEAFSSVEEGSTVSITISLGTKEQPPRTETVKVTVPYKQPESTDEGESGEGEEQPKEQKVLIYVGDMNNKITDVYKEQMITEDTTFEIPLTIKPGTEASYKVQRGDEVVEEGSVPY